MATNLQLYANAFVAINGALLTEETTVSVKLTSGSNPVKTTAKGYSGESPGSPMIEIEVGSAVPSADFEVNPNQFILGLQIVELSVILPNGKQLKSKGFIISNDFSHAVDSEAKISFSFRGEPADFE